MAILRNELDGEQVVLPSRCLVGRASTCLIRLDDRRISGEHAAVAWNGECWTVRDLGSRNGSWLDSKRLVPGEAHQLATGMSLSFAKSKRRWIVEDVGPPMAAARDLDSGRIVLAEDGMLTLPADDDPRACVFPADDGSWIAEVDGEPRAVTDGGLLQFDAYGWRLHLPEATATTVTVIDGGPTLDGLKIEFAVSADEEFVAVSLQHDGGRIDLPPKAHHYTLLVLARLRLKELHQPTGEQGWIYVDECCRMLAVDDLRLNTDVYRIRKELARQGVLGAASVVERRRPTRQLRLGVPATRLSVR